MHYGIHFLVPIGIGLYFYRKNWFWAVLILLAGILIDLDHLLASPIFDSARCSIGYHPLHTYWAFMFYLGLLFFQKTRIVGLALCIHIVADTADCILM
ncbi:MAG: hypothetical protein ACI8VZ_000600 [Candidatus Paceibacteria bacterium]|jgi:predicted cobalt transporter CbtA